MASRRVSTPTRSLDGKRYYASRMESHVCEAARDLHPGPWPVPHKCRVPYQLIYVPDLILPNGIVVEVKGAFPPEDRRKMLAVRAMWPTMDVRMVFGDPWRRCGRQVSPQQWCDRHGVTWAAQSVPREWIEEPPAAFDPTQFIT